MTGITTELISQLAIIALKRRLENQSDVKCSVNGRTRDMVFGKVGPVTVKGKGWKSPLGLTCRALEATVQECALDVSKVVQMRKLNLVVPAKGNAMIALNTIDFGNFITHPLLKPPIYKIDNEISEEITFDKDGVTIDSDLGTVHFVGSCMGESFNLVLSRGNDTGIENKKEALVKAVMIKGDTVNGGSEIVDKEEDDNAGDINKRLEMESDLSRIVSQYFTDLVFELDGTFLSYTDMMVTNKEKSPSLLLALSILVKKFPSPGIAF